MYTPDEIFSAAYAIGPELPRLLGANADAVQQQLTTLLNCDRSTPGLDNQILRLLVQHEATRTWTKAFLDEEADSTIVEKGFKQSSSSKPDVPSTQKFACPHPDCHKSWTRQSVGEEIPYCNEHRVYYERISA